MKENNKELKSIDIIKEMEELDNQELTNVEGGLDEAGTDCICDCWWGNSNKSTTA